MFRGVFLRDTLQNIFMESTSKDLRIRAARREVEQILNHYGIDWGEIVSGWYRSQPSRLEFDQSWNSIRGMWKKV